MQGSRENLCVSDVATVAAPLEAAWETIRAGLRRDCGARTFDGWLKPAELGAFDGDAGELDIVMMISNSRVKMISVGTNTASTSSEKCLASTSPFLPCSRWA